MRNAPRMHVFTARFLSVIGCIHILQWCVLLPQCVYPMLLALLCSEGKALRVVSHVRK